MLLCSDEDKQAFEVWHAHDDAEDNFCELDGECSVLLFQILICGCDLKTNKQHVKRALGYKIIM